MVNFLRYSLLFFLSFLFGETMYAADVSDVLTAGMFKATGTTYTSFSDVKATSSAVYAGNTAKSTSGAIQIRTTNSNSGIVTTTSGGKVKSVTIEFNSSTDNARVVDVYGKNSAYSAATDLYNNASGQGTKLGSIKKSEDNHTLTITDDYTYLALRSYNGAIYIDKITIVWDNGESGGGDTPVTLATPVISGDTPFEGSTTVTITHEKQDASIRYKKTGDTDWTDYVEPFTITETTTVQAVAEWDDINDNTLTSEIVSKTFTKMIAVADVNAFNALADGTTNVVLTLNNAVVLACGNNNYVVNDGTGGTNIFKLPSDLTVAQGTVLNGTVTGTRATYNGMPQMKDVSANTLTTTAGTATTTTVQLSVLVDAALFDALYKLDGVTVKKNPTDNRFYIYDGDTQIIQLYNQFKIVDPAEGTWNIEGVRGVFANSTSTTPQFWLTKMEATQAITYTDMTVAELCLLTENKDNINLTLDNALVAYKDGSTLYIREGEKSICAYNITLDGVTWKQGQIISGTVKVNMEIFRGMHEIKSNVGTVKDNLTITDPAEGTTVEPTEATVAELLAGKHVADYIILKNVQIISSGASSAKSLNGATAETSYYAKDDNDNQILLYTTSTTYTSKANDGKKYDIKAIFASAVDGSMNITPKGISEVTAINNLVVVGKAEDANAPMYNLAGQRVPNSYKGVVVVNGKKVRK